MFDWNSSDVASVKILSMLSEGGLTFLGAESGAVSEETVIEKRGDSFVATDRNSLERRIVATELLDQLLLAIREPIVPRPNPKYLGLTPAWFEAYIGEVIDEAANGYSEAGKQRFVERVGSYEYFCQQLSHCFEWTDDEVSVKVKVLIENRNGSVAELSTISPHPFMVPWLLDKKWSSSTFNANISRAVAALVPDGFLNKTSLTAEGIKYCCIGNARDDLMDLPTRSIHGHSGRICSLLFTPDGELLVSGALDNVIKVWDANRWTERHCFDMPRVSVNLSVDLASNGTTLAFNDAAVIKIADVQNGRSIRELRGHTWVVRKLIFSPDGMQLASEDCDGVRVWDVATGTEVQNLPQERLLGFSFGGVETGQIKEPMRQTHRLVVSPDGRQQALVSKHGVSHQKVAVSDLAKRHRPRRFVTKDVEAIAFSPDGGFIVTGHFDGHLAVWELPCE